MPQPQGAELEDVRARRAELKDKYLRNAGVRRVTTVRGVHHLALICRDVEETIRFYQELLGFPLVELGENRDEAGVTYIDPDRGIDNSLYIRDPNGVGIELYQGEGNLHSGSHASSVRGAECALA